MAAAAATAAAAREIAGPMAAASADPVPTAGDVPVADGAPMAAAHCRAQLAAAPSVAVRYAARDCARRQGEDALEHRRRLKEDLRRHVSCHPAPDATEARAPHETCRGPHWAPPRGAAPCAFAPRATQAASAAAGGAAPVDAVAQGVAAVPEAHCSALWHAASAGTARGATAAASEAAATLAANGMTRRLMDREQVAATAAAAQSEAQAVAGCGAICRLLQPAVFLWALKCGADADPHPDAPAAAHGCRAVQLIASAQQTDRSPPSQGCQECDS